MYYKLHLFRRHGIALFGLVVFVVLSLLPLNSVEAQGSVLTVTPLTWNIIGLDSNSPASGPRDFPVGAQVCNTGATPLTNVAVTFTWTSANAFVDFRPGTLTSINIPTLAAGACYDAYFEVEVVASAAAFDTTRSYVITATSGAVTGSSPQPRELYVEHLISQNRNATTSVQYGTNLAALTSVPAGGSMNLLVGQTYYIRLLGSTATQGYEQLESFLTLSNTIFQILGVSTTYSADTSPTVAAPNPSLYANGCLWENDPNSPNYRACLASGKAGGSVVTTYQVTILSGGGITQTLNSLLYDFSGSSFHYNSDFSVGARYASIIDPASATIAKQFTPNSIAAGGVSTLIITLGNPNGGVVSGYNFVDNLPAGVVIATPPQASTSGCGTPTFAPTAGATSLSFSNGTVAANGTCTLSVKVTAAAIGTYNNVTNNLFIDTVDTAKSGNATLTVTAAPPSPTCIPNQPMATWNFLTGSSATNPAPTTSNVTASTAAGAGLVPIISTQNIAGASGSWSSDNIATGAALVLANNEYFEFTLNTTGFSSVTLNFQAQRTTQGAQSVQLYYGITAPGTASSIYSLTAQNTWFAFGPTTLNTGLNPNGNTIFRLYVYNASLNNNGHSIDLDGVTFTGCGTPSNPSLTKAFAPTSIGAGGTSTLTFTLSNANTIALTGVSFSDTLPTGMTISAASSTTCGGTLTAGVGTGSVSLTGGTIAASGSCTVTVPVTKSTAGPSTNISGFISSTETGQNNTATGSASATLTVLSPPQMSKLFSPNPILVGGISTLTFTITNPNQNNAIGGVAFSDTFPVAPGAMVVANPPTATNTCGGVFTPVAGAASINLTNGSIVAGGSCTVSVRVTAPLIGSYANTSGNVSHVVNSVTFNGNTASNTLTVNAANPSISILKQVGTTATGPWSSYVSVVTGTNVFYLITVENTGDVPLSPVTVSDPNVNTVACTWPNPLPVANATNDNHIATCVVGPVAATAGVNPNTATANGTFGGTGYTDTSTATYATAALTLDKTANPTTFTTLGQIITYTFTVTNSGFATLSGPVTINDDLATDETCPALTTIGDGDNFFDPAEVIVCSATYAITAPDMTSGSVTNTATATSGGVSSPADAATITRIMADLSVTKTVDNATPTVGSSIIFTVTVSNAGTANATNVAVLDQLPAGFTYVSDIASQGAYVAGTGVWTVGTINSGTSATLQITATVNATGPYANIAQVSASDQPDPDSTPNNNSGAEDDQATSTATPGAVADLSIVKSVDNSTPTVGGNITFTVTVSNAGPNNATNVAVLDQLPAGYTFGSATPSQGTFSNLTGIWTVGTVNNGASATLQIIVTVNATGSYANTAQVSASDQADQDSVPNNNSAAEDDQATNTPIPVAVADLSLTKVASNNTPNVGSNITFTLAVSNAGPSAATNVAVQDQLPAGYTYVSDIPSQGTYVAGTGVWTVGTVNSGASATLQITVTVNATGSYANTAQVSASDQGDPDSTPNNNATGEDDQATNTPVPVGVADLSLTKVASNNTPNVGSNITFTITVNNGGPSIATNVAVQDQLPTGFTFISAVPSQGTFDNTTAIWTVGTINNGANATLQITVTVNATGSYANTAQVSASDQADPDSTPNNGAAEDDQATNTPTPVAVVDLFLAKVVDNPNPTVGNDVTYTITVGNNGPNDGTGVVVIDQLPAGVTFVSATPSQGAYDNTTGLWTVGAINSGADATLDITATVNTAGVITNSAQVTASDQTDTDSIPNNGVGNGEDDQASVTTPQGTSDLSLTKSVDNASPNVGSNIIFTITVANAGPNNATNITVQDQLPTGYTFVSSTPSQGTYNSLTGVWTIGTINNGANATLQITATVNAGGSYVNTAQITAADQFDPDSTPNNNTNGEDDQATNTPVPAALADLSLAKTIDNPNPNIGTNVVYTLTVSNNGPSDATGVEVTDQLPAGVTFVSSTPSQGAYDNTTGIWTVGTINNGANATLQITATVNVATAITNSAEVTDADQADTDSPHNNGIGNGEDDQASVSTLQGTADLSLTKTVGNPTPNVGASVTFTISVSNTGPNSATNVAVQDQLPAGYTFVGATASQGTYTNATGLWTVGTIANGASANLQIAVTVNAIGPYSNTAQVSVSDQFDPDSTPNNSVGGEDDQSTNTPTPVEVADLALAKVVDNPSPTIGSNFVYTLTASNIGPSDATNVAVLDQLPAGITFVSSTPSQGTYDSTTGIWAVGTLAANSNATLQIAVTLNAAGNITNSAQVSTSDQLDPDSLPNNGIGNGEDDQVSVTTPQGIADLSVTNTVDNVTPNVGSTITFTVTLGNAGPDNATNVAVQDQLPAGYTFVSSAPSQGTYDPVTGIWTVGTINNGANATLLITVIVNATGPYDTTAQVATSDQFDPDSTPNNNVTGEDDEAIVVVVPSGTPIPTPVPTSAPSAPSNNAPTPVIVIVDPVITKSVDPLFSQPGEVVTWTITVTNPGTIATTNIIVVDDMPPEVQIQTVLASAGNITTNGQTITFTLATLNAGQSVTITIRTRVRDDVPLPFVINNNASLTNAENLNPRSATAMLLSAAGLPETGEAPWWRIPLLIATIIAVGVILAVANLSYRQRNRS